MGLSQAALARKLGVTRASVNHGKWSYPLPRRLILWKMAWWFHTTTDDILGLTAEEQISLRGMTEQEKRLVYNLIDYISERINRNQKTALSGLTWKGGFSYLIRS